MILKKLIEISNVNVPNLIGNSVRKNYIKRKDQTKLVEFTKYLFNQLKNIKIDWDEPLIAQAEVLKDKYNLVHISTGDILRAEIKNGTELGESASVLMEKGDLFL